MQRLIWAIKQGRGEGKQLELCWWHWDRTRLQSSGLIPDFWGARGIPESGGNAEGKGTAQRISQSPGSSGTEQPDGSCQCERGHCCCWKTGRGKTGGKERGKRWLKDGLHWREGQRMRKDWGRGVWVQLSWLHSGEQTTVSEKKQNLV